jgi:hypothetical protein
MAPWLLREKEFFLPLCMEKTFSRIFKVGVTLLQGGVRPPPPLTPLKACLHLGLPEQDSKEDLRSVYTSTNLCTILLTISCTICTQARQGYNSFSDPHCNSMTTHFIKSNQKLTCGALLAANRTSESNADPYAKSHV